MEPVVTSAEMQACDRAAVAKLKIPSIILMENAGRGVVEKMQEYFGSLAGKQVLIFSGKGSNGGDGFVVARHLVSLGSRALVVLVGKSSHLKGDAKLNYGWLKGIQKRSSDETKLRFVELHSGRALGMLPNPDIIVDGLFGTGFRG